MQDTLYMEAYYGKLPEFEQIEACFASIIKKARTEKYKSNPNTYPETKKIQKEKRLEFSVRFLEKLRNLENLFGVLVVIILLLKKG